MSHAIDFDLGGRHLNHMGYETIKLHTSQKKRILRNYETTAVEDADYVTAKQTTKDDEPPSEDVTCFGCNVAQSCCGYNIDLISSIISGVLLLVTIGCSIAYYDERNILLSRDMLVYAQKTSNMTKAMRHFRTTFKNYSGEDAPIQVPHWRSERDVVVMTVSVKTAKISMFSLLIWVYFWSCFFQWLRYWKSNLYKPWRGPEFSRWLEYLFTSPCQAVLVSIAFGFATLDTLIGHFGM
jgi:hypothetical protein